MPWSELIAVILPTLSAIAIAFIMWVVGQISLVLKRKWGIEIDATSLQAEMNRVLVEKNHRSALHSAIETGASAVVAERGEEALQGPGVSAQVREHVMRSVPDAIAALSPAPDVLDRLVMSQLQKLVSAARGRR